MIRPVLERKHAAIKAPVPEIRDIIVLSLARLADRLVETENVVTKWR
jgi:hypothetical protein